MKTTFLHVQAIALASLVFASVFNQPEALAQNEPRRVMPAAPPKPVAPLALADGRRAEIANGMLLIVDASGRAAPAPAGEYRTMEGRVLHVAAGGMLTTAAVAPPATSPAPEVRPLHPLRIMPPEKPPGREPTPASPLIVEPGTPENRPLRPRIIAPPGGIIRRVPESTPPNHPANENEKNIPVLPGTVVGVKPHKVPDGDGGKGGATRAVSTPLPPVQSAVNPSAAPKVHTELKIYSALAPGSDSGGESGGLLPGSSGGVQLSTVVNMPYQSAGPIQLGWNATFPALVKKGRWEVAGIGDDPTPQWPENGAKPYPPLAGSGEVKFLPQTKGWSLFAIDFASVYAAKNFDWKAKAKYFYVRITPKHADGSDAGPASGYVTVNNSGPGIGSGKPPPPSAKPKPPTKPFITADHFTPDANFSAQGENTAMENGPELHMIVTRAPIGLVETAVANFYGVHNKGDKFVINLSPPSQDVEGFDAVMNFVGAVFKLVGQVIDFTSAEFAALKGDLVSVVAAVVQDKTLATALVDVAMSYCGIPPTLPDSEALQNAGADYIMDYAAEQAGGVPVPDELKGQVKGSISQMTQKVKATVNDQFAATFYKPDDAYFYHPPVLYLKASFPKPQNSSPVKNNAPDGSVSGQAGKTGDGTSKNTDPNADPSHHKLKVDPNSNDPDLSIPGPKKPDGQPPPPKHQAGQNVGEPKTDSTGGGNSAPSKSDSYDFDVQVSIAIQNGQFGNSDKVAKPVVFVAHVHVPPLRSGEKPIMIPVILRFGPLATSADVFERKAWYAGWDYNVNANYNFKIDGQVISRPLHKAW